jgi:hypothetical protein
LIKCLSPRKQQCGVWKVLIYILVSSVSRYEEGLKRSVECEDSMQFYAGYVVEEFIGCLMLTELTRMIE